jgi:PilZ domain
MAEHTLPAPSGHTKYKPETERRAWVRFAASQEVYCQAIAAPTAEMAGTAWLGRLRNVSSAGLALRLSRHFEPGSLLMLELEARGRVRSFPIRVVHATQEAHRHWIIGCEFITPLSEAELRALVE